MIKGRWACLPLSHRFYHLKKNMEAVQQKMPKSNLPFETKLTQAAEMISVISDVFADAP